MSYLGDSSGLQVRQQRLGWLSPGPAQHAAAQPAQLPVLPPEQGGRAPSLSAAQHRHRVVVRGAGATCATLGRPGVCPAAPISVPSRLLHAANATLKVLLSSAERHSACLEPPPGLREPHSPSRGRTPSRREGQPSPAAGAAPCRWLQPTAPGGGAATQHPWRPAARGRPCCCSSWSRRTAGEAGAVKRSALLRWVCSSASPAIRRGARAGRRSASTPWAACPAWAASSTATRRCAAPAAVPTRTALQPCPPASTLGRGPRLTLPPPTIRSQITQRWWFWLIIGLLAAFFIVLAFFAWRGFSQYKKLKRMRAEVGACSPIGGAAQALWLAAAQA